MAIYRQFFVVRKRIGHILVWPGGLEPRDQGPSLERIFLRGGRFHPRFFRIEYQPLSRLEALWRFAVGGRGRKFRRIERDQLSLDQGDGRRCGPTVEKEMGALGFQPKAVDAHDAGRFFLLCVRVDE